MFEKITSLITTAAIALTGLFTVDIPYTPTPQLQKPQQETTLGSFNPAAGGTYRLKTSVGTTDTTINLSSFKEPVSNIPLTMTILNTDIGYATIDPQSPTRKEFVSFTGITQNADGSATLTGVTRGLGFTYPFTASSTLRKEHPGQSIFILSDSPQFFAEYARVRSDESISGNWTVPTPTNASGIANKAYVDSIVSGGAVTLDGISVGATAGEGVATGTILYLFTDGKWYKANASTAASSTRMQLGVAQGTASTNNTIPGGVLTQGYDETNRGGVAGQTIFLANTAGATSTATGTVPVILGQMRSDSVFYFDPKYNNAPTGVFAPTTFYGTTTFAGDVVATNTVRTYLASTTYTLPSAVQRIFVEVWGGGGGGGRYNGVSGEAGGGGGGAYASALIPRGKLNATTSIIVGGGGAGSAFSGSGTNGGRSSFGNIVFAFGGGAGFGSVSEGGGGGGGGLMSTGTPSGGLAGGAAGLGCLSGEGVGSTYNDNLTSSSSYMCGAGGMAGYGTLTGKTGGNSVWGGAGGGGAESNGAGSSGTGGRSLGGGNGGNGSNGGSCTAGETPGGGGGAHTGSGSSCAGGSGMVRITEYY